MHQSPSAPHVQYGHSLQIFRAYCSRYSLFTQHCVHLEVSSPHWPGEQWPQQVDAFPLGPTVVALEQPLHSAQAVSVSLQSVDVFVDQQNGDWTTQEQFRQWPQ